MPTPFTVSTDHPGGNILIDRVSGDTVFLRQDLRDTEGWWFYWNFRVSGAQEQMLRFEFTNGNVIGTRGPAYTRDNGKTWAWLGADKVTATEKGAAFEFVFSNSDSCVEFAFSIPYLQSDLEAFLAGHPNLSVSQLCRSRNGRAVECIHRHPTHTEAACRLLLTARHHACESIADYVLEGILQSAESNDSAGEWLRDHVDIWAIPFVDKDGVEQGDQGKNRRPRDHNRDYGDPSIYPETDAVKGMVSSWSSAIPTIALDLHCPHIRGANNEDIYMVGSAKSAIQEAQRKLSRILEAGVTGELPYRDATFLPFGTSWNVAGNFSQGMSCTRWMSEQEHIVLATSFEIPYAAAGGVTVTRKNARQFGHDIAESLRAYMDTQP